MGFSEIPLPPEEIPGCDLPAIQARPPGPQSRTWLLRNSVNVAPMGPRQSLSPRGKEKPAGIVYSTAKGSNVLDVDGNRYVDLAAGFGALLLGHAHPRILKVLELQAERLMQALGDVYTSEPRIALCERLARLYPERAQVILGQSGADAVSAALKTAVLATGKSGVVAFEGSYHGLSYGPLAATSLRESYRQPFAEQLNPAVRFVPYPASVGLLDLALERVRFELVRGDVGAVLVEPILGRGGVIVPPQGFLEELKELTQQHGALLIADEIWTALGRAGDMLVSVARGVTPDLICLGKGLGGGLPISACIGSVETMAAWRREHEVVHTATFAGAPLACATAIATLDVLRRDRLVERAHEVGQAFGARLRAAVEGAAPDCTVRGQGLMWGVELPQRGNGGAAVRLMRALLEAGYIVSTGGGTRDVMVLTPSLVIGENQLEAFVAELPLALQACGP
ncbi:MAG: aspartate aminotransferase family protein [Myxococcales bacterium]|nr:aspartate aminotransferase family protein [Myxococcales bacterium]